MFRPIVKTLGVLAVAGIVLATVLLGARFGARAQGPGVALAAGPGQLDGIPPCAPGFVPNVDVPGCHAAGPPCPSGYLPNGDASGCHPASQPSVPPPASGPPPCAPGFVPNGNGTGCVAARPPCASGTVFDSNVGQCVVATVATPPCAPGSIPNGSGSGCTPAPAISTPAPAISTPAPSTSPPPLAPTDTTTACGTITVQDQHPVSSNAGSAANCFFTAYQSCSPARLVIQFSPAGPGSWHDLTLQASSGGCSVSDEAVATADSAPSGSPEYTTCASLQLSGSQLQTSSCGGPPLIVPLS